MNPEQERQLQVKDLRKRAGISQTELARRINVDTSLVSRWEKGEREPTSQQVVDIVRALGISLDYALNAQVRPVFKFRAQASAERDAAVQQALRDAEVQVHCVDAAHRLANRIPAPCTLRMDFGIDQIQTLANQVRIQLKLNERLSYAELAQAMSELNINVFAWHMPHKISGMSFRGPFSVAFVNENHGERRRLFTLAHELAHILFHLRENSATTVSSFSSNRDMDEKEANAFAAELLMPTDTMEALVREYGMRLRSPMLLDTIADWLNVSRDAIFYRLVKWDVFSWADKSAYFSNKLPDEKTDNGIRVNEITQQVAPAFRRLVLELLDREEVSEGKVAEWFAAARSDVSKFLASRRHERESVIEF